MLAKYSLLLYSILIAQFSLSGQNYVDSAKILAREMAQDSDLVAFSPALHELDSILQPKTPDTTLARLIAECAVKVTGDASLDQFQQRFADFKLAQDIGAEERSLFLNHKANALINQGIYLINIGRPDEGIDLSYQALRLKRQTQDTASLAFTLINLGAFHFNLRGYEEAVEHWQEALGYYQDLQDTVKLSLTYSYLGMAAQKRGQDSATESYFRQALYYNEFLDDPMDRYYALDNLGYFYLQKNELEKALVYLEEVVDILRGQENLYDKFIQTLFSLFDASMKLNRLEEAAKYEREARETPAPYVSLGSQREIHRMAYELNKRIGNYQKALKAYENYSIIYDSINNEKNFQSLFREKYANQALSDSLNNVAALALEKEVSKRRENFSYFLLVILVIILIFGWLLYNRFRLTNRQKQIIETERDKLDQAHTKLKELDDFKSRFFTNISHEFRTPLTVIRGMMEQVEKNPDKWLKKGSELVNRNVDNLLNLINQILDLRKLESGKLPLNLIQDDVIPYMRYISESYESLAADKSIDLSFQSEIPQQMMDFDPDRMLQIQTNLISNAIKFTESGGKVEVRLSKTSDNQLKLVVNDTGSGIPKEKVPFIFDRFYQADNTDSRQGEGTGIGLSLTKELVSLMGGEISVESELDKGTSFTVLLPIFNQAPINRKTQASLTAIKPLTITNSDPALSPATLTGEQPSLLIIEDNPDITKYLCACLEDHYEILTAPDGQVGIEIALEQVPDLIITDAMMPRKNGYEVCETLKLDERTSHIPIVMLTAKADQESRLEGYKRGADAYLTKPFDQEELMIRLVRLLEVRKALQKRYQKGELPAKTEDPIVQVEDEFVTKTRQLIIDNLDDNHYRGDSICKDMGISRTNLYRKIKALTGQSISHFIRSVRIQYSKELLINPELNIADIAYTVGFNDPGYYIRVFREMEGSAPGEWREHLMT